MIHSINSVEGEGEGEGVGVCKNAQGSLAVSRVFVLLAKVEGSSSVSVPRQ